MSNEELLARIDERLRATIDKIEMIYDHTLSIDQRLQGVESDIKDLQKEVNKIPLMEQEVKDMTKWKDQLGGTWKGVVLVSLVATTVITMLIQFFKGD